MSFSNECNCLFDKQIDLYHIEDSVDSDLPNPYQKGTIEHLLFLKNRIDTVQWHLEDIIREPSIDPVKALEIKRRIDKSNQDRTDLVEKIDDWFYSKFLDVPKIEGAGINTETPAWAIDRLSILALKIYHMGIEAARTDATPEHNEACRRKLDTLMEQREDLSGAIDSLLEDFQNGKKYMKLYRQMKMYNDPSLNPVLYSK